MEFKNEEFVGGPGQASVSRLESSGKKH